MGELEQGVAQVFTAVNLITGVLGGLLAGYFLVGLVAADPTWVSPLATPRRVAVLVASYNVAVGGLFYLGQTVAALMDGDTGWPRLATRFLLWIVFSLALGVGTYARLVVHARQRERQARERVRRELG